MRIPMNVGATTAALTQPVTRAVEASVSASPVRKGLLLGGSAVLLALAGIALIGCSSPQNESQLASESSGIKLPRELDDALIALNHDMYQHESRETAEQLRRVAQASPRSTTDTANIIRAAKFMSSYDYEAAWLVPLVKAGLESQHSTGDVLRILEFFNQQGSAQTPWVDVRRVFTGNIARDRHEAAVIALNSSRSAGELLNMLDYAGESSDSAKLKTFRHYESAPLHRSFTETQAIEHVFPDFSRIWESSDSDSLIDLSLRSRRSVDEIRTYVELRRDDRNDDFELTDEFRDWLAAG